MGKSTKDGRRKSGSMPTVRIDRKNKQARVFIGGKQHHLGRVEGDKISPAQAAEAARICLELMACVTNVTKFLQSIPVKAKREKVTQST